MVLAKRSAKQTNDESGLALRLKDFFIDPKLMGPYTMEIGYFQSAQSSGSDEMTFQLLAAFI